VTPLRVAVVGGGIAGLAAAHRLVELGRDRALPLAVTLVEARERLGGTIHTVAEDGFVLEEGPDSFISEKPWALALAERIGLGSRLCRTDDRHRRTYVAHGGRLHPLPDGFLLLAPARVWPFVGSSLFSWRGKLRMALDLVLPRRPADGDESLAGFVTRRLGREALERVAAPLVAGIYTADPERLSLAATMPRFLALERDHRSVILGLRKSAGSREVASASGARWSLFVTLRGGMGELVDALAARLPPGTARLGCPVAAIAREPGAAGWSVRLADGAALAADGVILAGEAVRMAPLVRALDPELARLLGSIGYASSVTVTLAYPRDAIAHPLDGFGFVVPRGEERAALACTFSSVTGRSSGSSSAGPGARRCSPGTTPPSRGWPRRTCGRSSAGGARPSSPASPATRPRCRSTRWGTSPGWRRSRRGWPGSPAWRWRAPPIAAWGSPTASAPASRARRRSSPP
jgi:oxygen-dependent protoporphyrinogen oxidase